MSVDLENDVKIELTASPVFVPITSVPSVPTPSLSSSPSQPRLTSLPSSPGQVVPGQVQVQVQNQLPALALTPSTKYEWTLTEFNMLESTYEKLSLNCARLLETSKRSNYKENVMQYLVVILGLTSSFVAALPGINETVRAYITSSFTLLTAILTGWMSKKAYGQKGGKYYSAYQEYKDLLTNIDNIMVTLKSDRDYESFNFLISKIEAKYEIFLPIDEIDELKIRERCKEKFLHLHRRFQELEREKVKEKYKLFINRKSYIYMYEAKLNLYRQYVYYEKVVKKSTRIFSCSEYEDWCRIHFPERYQEITRNYDRYVKRQTERFFLANGTDHNTQAIETELSTRRTMSLPDTEFHRLIHERFVEFQNQIRNKEYTETDAQPRSDENYSLEWND